MGDQSVQSPIAQGGDPAEHIRSLGHTASDLIGDLLGKEKQLVFIGIEGGCELLDQHFGRIVPEVQPLVLDLRDVREGDADLAPEHTLREVLSFPQFPDPFAESHWLPSTHA